jgi:hypothetical protein
LCGSHDLHLGIITIEIDENKLGPGGTDGHNSASECNFLVLKENTLLNTEGIEGLGELINAVSAVKFVRVWVLALLSHLLNKLLSVVGVLGGIQDLLRRLRLTTCGGRLLGGLFLLLLLLLGLFLILLPLGLFLFSQLLSGFELTTRKGDVRSNKF